MTDELVGRLGSYEVELNREKHLVVIGNSEEGITLYFEDIDDWIKLLWRARNLIQPKAVLCRECIHWEERRCLITPDKVVSGKKALCTRGVKKE